MAARRAAAACSWSATCDSEAACSAAGTLSHMGPTLTSRLAGGGEALAAAGEAALAAPGSSAFAVTCSGCSKPNVSTPSGAGRLEAAERPSTSASSRTPPERSRKAVKQQLSTCAVTTCPSSGSTATLATRPYGSSQRNAIAAAGAVAAAGEPAAAAARGGSGDTAKTPRQCNPSKLDATALNSATGRVARYWGACYNYAVIDIQMSWLRGIRYFSFCKSRFPLVSVDFIMSCFVRKRCFFCIHKSIGSPPLCAGGVA